MTEAENLIQIIEGLKGSMEHGTWRDDKGMRLKDTKEWIEFYLATRRSGYGREPLDHKTGE